MKKILNALFLTLLAVLTFSSCSDVPSPYDIKEKEDIQLTGDGTKESPYDVASAMQIQDGSEAWVQGYIVGSADGKSLADGSKFEAPFVGVSNILIADDVNEKDYKKCIPVQLVYGTEVRSKLNLVDNVGNLGKVVIIKGSLGEYFKQPGVKTATAAVLDKVEIGEGGGGEDLDPDNPLGLDDSKPVDSFSATFDDAVNNQNYALENWYNVAVAGGRCWQGKIFNADKYIQATSYNGTGSNFECWFVTPAFKVDEIADKTVSFKCAVYNYATAAANSNLEVYFLKLVNGKMQSEKLTITGMPTTDNTWVSLEAKLDKFTGTGFVGFKYTSTSNTDALSYRLDDIQAGKGEGGEEPGPGPEPESKNLLVNPGFEEWIDKLPTGWNSKYNTGEIVKETSIKHSGSNSLKQKSEDSTNKIQQEVAVEGGKKYRLSYWFLDNDPKARSRYWFALVDSNKKTVNDINAQIQQSTYSEDNAEWQQVKIEVTIPSNDVLLRYEVRTYRGQDAMGSGGGYIYYDDLELVEIE